MVDAVVWGIAGVDAAVNTMSRTYGNTGTATGSQNALPVTVP